jgi:hypothetical protein
MKNQETPPHTHPHFHARTLLLFRTHTLHIHYLRRYRWDGTNRSNGFEERMLGAMTAGRIKASDTYKWSVSDM